MAKALVIHPGESPAVKDVDGYRDLANEIGGFVEAVVVSGDAIAFMHEDGKALGLERNALARNLLVSAGCGLHPADWIAGPVVVYGNPDEDGELSDVPDRVVGLAKVLAPRVGPHC